MDDSAIFQGVNVLYPGGISDFHVNDVGGSDCIGLSTCLRASFKAETD